MRKITQESRDAFIAGKPFRKDNMEVAVRPWQDQKHDSVILLLYGNPIARYNAGDRKLTTLQVCDGNHQAVTTKDRLNSLPGVRVNSVKERWFLNDQLWDGCWTYVMPAITVTRFTEGGAGRWWVECPGLPTAKFTREAAALAYAKVEQSNTGMPLRIAA